MKKKSIKTPIIVIIISAFLISLSYFMYVKSTVNKNSSLIYPNVNINGIDVSSLDREQALELLEYHFTKEAYRRKVTYIVEEKEYVLQLSDLNPVMSYEETVDLAMSYGKNLGLYEQYQLIKNAPPKTFQLVVKYDAAPLTTLIKKFSEDIACDPINATLKRENRGFVVTDEKPGKSIDYDSIIDASLAEFNKNRISDVIIKVPINYIQPAVKAEELRAVNTLISSHTTNLSGSSPGRITNVIIATDKISNRVLMPGEEFSFNSSVGQVNMENGFKEAKVILKNKLVPGIGGGICQVSSTLYNAVLKSNIIPTERHHHTLPSTYVPIGLDATISSNYLDYKFVNTLPYPVLITGFVSNNKSVTFNIYSNDTLAQSQFSISSKVTKITQNKIKYIKDPDLAIGTDVVEQKGTKGYNVDVYLTETQNGKVVSQKLLYKDFYAPVTRIVKRGIKNTRPVAIELESRDPFDNEEKKNDE